MVTKKELLKDIRSYSPQEIAEAIKNGVVSMYDLSKETEGAFTPLLKRQVKAALNATACSSQEDLSHDTTLEQATVITDKVEPEKADTPPIQKVSEQPEIPVLSYTGNEVEEDKSNISSGEQTIPVSSDRPHENSKMFRKIFSFKGRIRRTEYGLTYLAYWLWNLPINVMTESEISEAYAVIYLLLFVPTVWILIAQGTKRCHDRGNSGWFQIIPFYFLWMVFAEGDSGDNEYGKSPK